MTTTTARTVWTGAQPVTVEAEIAASSARLCGAAAIAGLTVAEFVALPGSATARHFRTYDKRAATVVTDCPSCAWTNCGSTGLGSFGAIYHDDLTDAAVELVRQPLIAAWRKRGYRVRLVGHAECAAIPASSEDPADETYQAVWREACDEVDSDALLAFTELAETYRDYLGEK